MIASSVSGDIKTMVFYSHVALVRRVLFEPEAGEGGLGWSQLRALNARRLMGAIGRHLRERPTRKEGSRPGW